MGFFKGLKEDIVQSVNELSDSLGDVLEEDETVTTIENPEQAQEELTEENVEEETIEETAIQDSAVEEKVNDEILEDSSVQDVEEVSDEKTIETEEKQQPERRIEKPVREVNRTTNRHMEGRKMSDFKSSKDTEAVTVITEGTTISGGIRSDTALDVKGIIEGDVECQGKLTITGQVDGNCSATEIYVNTPRLEGNLDSLGSVKIDADTIIIGSITGTSAVIAGAVKGDIDVEGSVVIDSAAVVQGNIAAKSLQVNSGAIIEGFCSMKYADVDLEAFFE